MTEAVRPIAAILFPLPLPEAFDYVIPEGVELAPGDHVLAPLGKRSARGVVWAIKPGDPERTKLKPVEAATGGPPLPEGTRRFVDWLARYLVQPPGIILRSVLRSADALKPSPVETVYARGSGEPDRMTDARQRVLDAVEVLGEASAADIAREAGVTASVVKGLAKSGALTAITRDVDPP